MARWELYNWEPPWAYHSRIETSCPMVSLEFHGRSACEESSKKKIQFVLVTIESESFTKKWRKGLQSYSIHKVFFFATTEIFLLFFMISLTSRWLLYNIPHRLFNCFCFFFSFVNHLTNVVYLCVCVSECLLLMSFYASHPLITFLLLILFIFFL